MLRNYGLHTRRISLKQEMEIKKNKNNFDFLRFFAALLVIFSHSFALLFGKQDPYVNLTGVMTFGTLAVIIFFVISGFLISKSWDSSENIMDYAKKRVLRIYPAIFIVIILTIFILGPLVTTLTPIEYFSNPKTFLYLINISIIYLYETLPGVFFDNPYTNSVNGSLWTLPIELECYILTALFGIIPFFKKRFSTFIIVLFFIVLDFYFREKGISFFAYFFIGRLYYLYREKFILNKYLFIILALILLFSMSFKITYYLHFLILPYLIFYSIYRFRFLNNWGKYGDFSYGTYIYAFPVQQTLIYFFRNNLTIFSLFIFSSIITFIFAFLSWHVVEKNALKLKKIKIRQYFKGLIFNKNEDINNFSKL